MLSQKAYETLLNQLRIHEGERLQVYKCTAGYFTIGVGHNLESNPLPKFILDKMGILTTDKIKVIGILQQRGITRAESELILRYDISVLSDEIVRGIPFIHSLKETAKIVLYDMAFNLGVKGLLKFKKTLEYIKEGNYKLASHEMLNSTWAAQVGKRAVTLSKMLATC